MLSHHALRYSTFEALIEMLVRVGEWKAMVNGGLLVGLFSFKLSIYYHGSFVLLPGLIKIRIQLFARSRTVYFKEAA